MKKDPIISTTEVPPNFKVTEWVGLISGTCIIGSSFFKDATSRVMDFLGGEATGYSRDYDESILTAYKRLKETAINSNIDAVFGVKPITNTLPTSRGGFFVVGMVGTAVRGNFDE